MLLNEQQAGIRDMAREFARKEIAPFAAQWDRDELVPHDTLKKMGRLGLMGVCVPQEWGGAGADFVSYVAAMEEIARGDAGISNMMAATNSRWPRRCSLLETTTRRSAFSDRWRPAKPWRRSC